VVLMGDNGWHFGEKNHWGKTTLWEESTRVPFIWKVPGLTKPGTICGRTVDFMAIYPTLTDLCGVATPSHVQGVSIRSLLQDPQAPWTQPAITTSQEGQHTVRTERWRYIRYQDGGVELYDEVADPFEWTNLAGQKEYADRLQELAAFLPKENKPTLARSAGGAEEGEASEPNVNRADRAAARKARKGKE